MREVVYAMSMSLDGFTEAPGHDIGWHVVDEELHSYFNDRERDLAGTQVLGRRMYELMAEYWPMAAEDSTLPWFEQDYGRIWVDLEKVVVSSTLERADWNTRIVRGDPVGEVGRLKAQPGGPITVGGAMLAQALIEADLVDRYEVTVQPVVLGAGTPMFPSLPARLGLRLVWSRTFGSGVVGLRYVRDR